MINAFEVTLKLVNKNTREVTSVVRTEHSYNVTDAMMQAVMNQSAEIETGSADITVLRREATGRIIPLTRF